MGELADLWGLLTATRPPLDPVASLLAIVASVVLVAVTPLWQLVRHVVTIAHEGGHAVVATLAGRRLSGIRLHADTSGLTVSRGRPDGIGMVLTLLAGYPAAGVLGLGAAWAVSGGYTVGMLWMLLLLLAALLVQVRNWFGLWSVLVTGALLLAVTLIGAPDVQGVFAIVVTGVLVLGAVRSSFELGRARRRRGGGMSDADQLARLTRIPAIVWVGVFIVASGACAVGAGVLLGVNGWLPGA
ncbi:M50 family metallopeptidase [Marisediminicola senii]|uniref:M50 family metallopeptidase n=1 Tax=Marisediminicola senii TaxID=2711233 RepID=UPI0013ECCD2B|nr:M50 family metallopeptidase [Marisediminicola senii]